MMSRIECLLGLAVLLLAASCSEAEGDAGATTTAAGAGGASTTIATGPAPASSSSGSGGDGGSGVGGSEGSAGGTTGQGGCLEPPPPEVCEGILGWTECEEAGCGWYYNVPYLTLLGDECDYSERDFCLALDRCLAGEELLGFFRGEEVIQATGPCDLVQGWTPCSGAETDPPACACAENELTCD